MNKAIPLADECATTTLPRDAAGLYVIANMISSIIEYGTPVCDEALEEFIQTMFKKISEATSQKQKTAYNESIKLMRNMYEGGLE